MPHTTPCDTASEDRVQPTRWRQRLRQRVLPVLVIGVVLMAGIASVEPAAAGDADHSDSPPECDVHHTTGEGQYQCQCQDQTDRSQQQSQHHSSHYQSQTEGESNTDTDAQITTTGGCESPDASSQQESVKGMNELAKLIYSHGVDIGHSPQCDCRNSDSGSPPESRE